MAVKTIPSVDDQYKNWLETQRFINPPEEGYVKDVLIKELKFLSSMSVEEYTLYRKWMEIRYKYPKQSGSESISFFFGEEKPQYYELKVMKDNIWIPNDPMDYLKLQPKLVWHDEDTVEDWNTWRTFISTMLNNPNIGRQLFYSVIDEVTGKMLGVLCMSGDFLDLTPRDNYIGWSREHKTSSGMLNHTAIGSTIVPTQPLCYSYVGGKLLALLLLSDVLAKKWKERYDDILVGITTTSIYSSYSQYQNLSYWAKRGHSKGSIKFEPSKETVNLVKDWLRHNHTRRYFEWYHGLNKNGQPLKRDHKQRSLSFAYSKLGIPQELVLTNHQRGIYFCILYTNTCEYLRMEIPEEKLIKRFDNSVDVLVKLWKEKYAKKRIEAILKDGRYSTDTLFYNDLIGVTWEEAKEKYLKDVGR
jgi:hypothetical protein